MNQAADALLWLENGQSALRGRLLRLYSKLDQKFLELANQFSADEYLFPPIVSIADLARVDYIRSFPHLVTFAVAASNREEHQQSLAEDQTVNSTSVPLACLDPPKNALAPAACYPLYKAISGTSLSESAYLTTRAWCFRRESYFEPLQRQWSFSMREVVCVGTMDAVHRFIDVSREWINSLIRTWKINATWQEATDAFFRPLSNPKYIAQKLEPSKWELLFEDQLAIASINFHRNYFGDIFAISANHAPAFSACVAFGVERWVHAILHTFGDSENGWPA